MENKQWLNCLLLAVICPLITGAPSSMSQTNGPCPTEDLAITGGSFVISDSHGPIVKYSCPEGFYPSVLTRKCRDGSWDPKTTKKRAECKKVTCPNPRVFENGEVTPYKDRYYVNDTTNYTCHSDYVFGGSAHRVCKPNGKWSGGTPICGRNSDHCPDPGVPPGSHRTGHMFNIDDKVTYRCENKLTLIGSKQRVCQEGGQWSGTEPQCYAEFTYDTPEEASQAFGSSLKTNLEFYKENEDQTTKKVRLDQNEKLDIYIYVDASDSIEKKDFNEAKDIIKSLIDTISYYQVSPNYEIQMFATDVRKIVTMRNFKNITTERNLEEISQRLDDFTYESKGDRSGTNIANAFKTILESMQIEQIRDSKNFPETQHVIIMFTDGHANMGGNPKPKVEQIKHLISDPNKLDIYIFGVGEDVNTEEMNELVTKRGEEKFFFKLKELKDVQETFDQMIDEGTSNQLCGIQQSVANNKRRAFPWLAQIKVTRHPVGSNCMGSLVTPTYILTAAHCFRFGDKPEQISITLKKDEKVTAKRIIPHSNYSLEAKKHIGIPEYYEFDVALIELDKPVKLDRELRTICLPCTKETNGALKLSDKEVTCTKHEQVIMSVKAVNANFTSEMENDSPKHIRSVTIKLRELRDSCVEDAKKADIFKKSNKTLNAKDIVTDNFLCSGGLLPTTDHISCKGDSGGATYLHYNNRVIQVGIVSWGSRNKCNDNKENTLSDEDSRDYHTNLFSPAIRSFLKEHLGKENQKGTPLTFLSD